MTKPPCAYFLPFAQRGVQIYVHKNEGIGTLPFSAVKYMHKEYDLQKNRLLFYFGTCFLFITFFSLLFSFCKSPLQSTKNVLS